jgi:hypothetical protein
LSKFFPPSTDIVISAKEITVVSGPHNGSCKSIDSTELHAPTVAEISSALGVVLADLSTKGVREVNLWLTLKYFEIDVVKLDARTASKSFIKAGLSAYWLDALAGTRIAAAPSHSFQVQSNGRSAITAACDSNLINALKSSIAKSPCVLGRVSLNLARVWNLKLENSEFSGGYVLFYEDETLSIGLLQAGQWLAWSSEACFAKTADELFDCARAFARRSANQDCTELPVWIYAPSLSGANAQGWIENFRADTPVLQIEEVNS